MSLDAVIKVGGSLSRGAGLVNLCREISRLGKLYSLLVVPGGGKFADHVREAYREYKLNETSAHCMALLAMDQYGYLLNQLIENSLLSSDLPEAQANAESGQASILLPSKIILQSDPLPHSWQVTSDSIAAWVAQIAGCPRLILLKDVDGLLDSSQDLMDEISAEKLAGLAGGVDGYLSKLLSTARLEVWALNGNTPERLAELLENNHTTGTRIINAIT
jgi:5-(aminomethyl)-3-furanmethanol phosphate kinase